MIIWAGVPAAVMAVLTAFLGSIKAVQAWFGLGKSVIFMCLGPLFEIGGHYHTSDPVPVPLLVTAAATGLVSLVLAQLLPRIRTASTDAFMSSTRPSW
jgi:hypothetical protein